MQIYLYVYKSVCMHIDSTHCCTHPGAAAAAAGEGGQIVTLTGASKLDELHSKVLARQSKRRSRPLSPFPFHSLSCSIFSSPIDELRSDMSVHCSKHLSFSLSRATSSAFHSLFLASTSLPPFALSLSHTLSFYTSLSHIERLPFSLSQERHCLLSLSLSLFLYTSFATR